ncbi:dynein light intermediate chain-domain-containing protein [Sporodiniella umbellata]|nr:dynein light intermediate chain-domain-containing protein [Sporodiniella umbellata]
MTISSSNNVQPQGVPEKEEIWSTILSTVASSKMVPTKRVLVLGDSSSGKSTLIHFLKNDPGPQAAQADNDLIPTTSFGVNNNYVPLPVENLDDDTTSTLALGYNAIDIQDEENEAIARLGVYQLGLSAAEYLPLLKFALGTDTLADSCVIIVLDWTRPWVFLESLQRWIHVLQHRIDEICKDGSAGESWSKGKAIVDELREKVENYLQTYTEPANLNPLNITTSTSTGSVPSTPSTATTTNFQNATVPTTPLVTTTTSADQVTLPLSKGTLTDNLGIPIIVVCCKSDSVDMLDQTLDYKDEHFDFIQQMLRCVCMKYGAALFYTSTRQPYTFHNLRQYLLHRLLTTPTKSYPFNMKAQVIERDVVLVPSGWDSWGKLKVLREGFDCEAVNDGWNADMDAVADRQQPGAHGSRGMYEEVISDPSSKDQPLNTVPPPVTCEEEQAFLDRHYETLKHVSDTPSRKGTGASTRPSVVGPIGNPTSDADFARSADNSKLRDSAADKSIKMSSSSGSSISASGTPSSGAMLGIPSANTGTSTSGSSAALSLPPIDTGNGAGQPGGPSHEVLANFFQSLLSKKASSGGSSPTSLLGSRDGEHVTNNTASPTSSRRPTISRKDVHKELDRMKQLVNKP